MPATGRVTGYHVHLHPLLPSGQPVSEDQRQVELNSHFAEHQLQVTGAGLSSAEAADCSAYLGDDTISLRHPRQSPMHWQKIPEA